MTSSFESQNVPRLGLRSRHWKERAGQLRQALLRAFAYGSLRSRLVVIVLAIDCLAAALTGSVVIYKGRTATKLEIASSMQLADLLVTDTIRVMKDAPASLLLQTIDLQFRSVRHVRITVTDSDGRPVQAGLSADAQAARTSVAPEAPEWFSRLVAPPSTVKVFPVLLHNRRVGDVTITSEPSDEVGEAWHYAEALLVTGSCLNTAVLFILFVLFGRALAPLTALTKGLKNLEARNYAVRLPLPSLTELRVITDHFNRTAEALLSANAANRTLNRKLLTAQDDERRRTALELHDEVGPCLFALDVNASSIALMTKGLADGGRIHERATEVVTLCKQVQGINRRVLDRLRPMGLGQIPLQERLLKLLVDFDCDGTPSIEHEIGPLEASYGVLVDLTIYRCMQEGLFNAIRHARASRINLHVKDQGETADARRILIIVRDDGRGLQQPSRSGIGLAGMRERVEALCGTFAFCSSADGTTLTITLPLEEGDDARDASDARTVISVGDR